MISYVALCAVFLTVIAEEPHCSKYDFEEKILEKLVRMEYQMERMKIEGLERAENMAKTKTEVATALETLDQSVAKIKSKLEEESTAFEQKMTETVGKMMKRVENVAEASTIPKIVFKARLNSHMTVTSGVYIVFPTTLLNEGGAYDSSSGIFTAPVNGTYMFNVIFCVFAGKSLYIDIMVDDTKTAPVVFRNSANNACHSAVTVEVLTVGQRVGIQVLSTRTGNVIYHGSSTRWNTFSGTLLHTH
ncbi:C1q-related factor-like [Mercenaria mercenaria]|uniref:C1q-related factor-like n=1 Tax=Mercenaria mercenaria TaxID=6596 RepID=UPI00234F3172|nr:C1q-related factor-like [Mercenaria mercenaria]